MRKTEYVRGSMSGESDTSTSIDKRRRSVDWEKVESQYRAGIMTLRVMAEAHNITEGAIRKRAKRDGWARDLAAKIEAKAEVRLIAEQDALDRSGFVYVIYVVDSAGERFYKIGMSASFSARAGAHQCSSPFDVCVACAYFVGNMRQEESILHALFEAKRVRGEWFRLDRGDLAEIAQRSLLV